MYIYVCIYTGVYLIFITDGKIWKTPGHIDARTVYVHSSHSRTAGKMTVTSGDIRLLLPFE